MRSPYLAVAGGRAMLLVGSGNLSVSGLDDGREGVHVFRSGTTSGDRAIAVWRSWMRRLVRLVDDGLLTHRFADLEQRLPAPTAEPDDGTRPTLVHNLDVALLDRLTVAVGVSRTDEMILTAPFYDPDAEAVARLVEALGPRRVTIFLGAKTSVDGRGLRRVLGARDVRFLALNPDEFTHAKLVGVTLRTEDPLPTRRGGCACGSRGFGSTAVTALLLVMSGGMLTSSDRPTGLPAGSSR